MSRCMIEYCKPEAGERMGFLHPIALEIMAYVAGTCEGMAVPCVIADTVSTAEEDLRLARTSSTHREGRAFDLSCRDLSDAAITAIITRASDRFGQYGAVRMSGKKCLAYVHDAGTGKHIHFQIDRRFACSERHFGAINQPSGIQ